MSLAWYIRRLTSMSPPEVAHRVVEQVKRKSSRGRPHAWAGRSQPPRILEGLRQGFAQHAGEAFRARVQEAAQLALSGRFHALGVDWPQRSPHDLFPADVWRLDPVTGKSWPTGMFCFDLPYRHERVLGDIKYVWEFNRLQHLQPLAAAYALNGDPVALEAVRKGVQSWIDANPPYIGLGWNSGIEVALRAVSLILVDSLCGDALGHELRCRIGDVLEASLYWLARFPSGFSSANNHLVAEALGEYLIALAVPEAPSAEAARLRARRILVQEAAKQIYADGAPAEQSPTYGAFTAEMLLLAEQVAAADDQPLDLVVLDRLGEFARFIGWIVLADGGAPAIGDDDEGRVLSLCLPNPAYASTIANAIFARRGETAPAGVAGPPELLSAVIGAAPVAAQPAKGLKTFPEGGYSCIRAALRGEDASVIMDHGPLGYLSIAAHGHADACMLLLSLGGRPVLIDPGTYLYHSGAEWRDWFRGTPAHNTLAIEGQDQSQISGPFNWSRKANARLLNAAGEAGYQLEATHDGYRAPFGVDHIRRVEFDAEALRVTDRFQAGAPERIATLTWQFAPGLRLEGAGLDWRVFDADREILTVALDPAGTARLRTDGEGLGGGWASPHFGAKVLAPRLVWEGPVSAKGVTTTFR